MGKNLKGRRLKRKEPDIETVPEGIKIGLHLSDPTELSYWHRNSWAEINGDPTGSGKGKKGPSAEGERCVKSAMKMPSTPFFAPQGRRPKPRIEVGGGGFR